MEVVYMKVLPPEVVDAIIAIAGTLLGWLARWLKGDVKAQRAENKVKALENYINNIKNNRKS